LLLFTQAVCKRLQRHIYNIRNGWQAVLAGAAEWLSAEFDLPKPAWVDKPQT
jgi:hypothetical protein